MVNLKEKITLYTFKPNTIKKFLPVEDVSEIFVFGEVTLNKRFLEFLTQKKIIIHFFNNYGYYTGSFYPREHLNSGYMTLKQAEHYLDESKRFNLASIFITGAVSNIEKVLKYYQNRGKEVENNIKTIQTLFKTIPQCKTINELMAIEGNVRNNYYSSFNEILSNEDFHYRSRTRRPPQDRLNALISYGNTMSYVTVLSEIYKTHLDPRIGFLHTTNLRRFTLNLDVAEIFKPVLVDRVIFYLVAKKMLRKPHFEKQTNGIYLNEHGRKIFIKQWENRLRSTINHRGLGRNVSYRRLIRMELYKLEKHFIGEKSMNHIFRSGNSKKALQSIEEINERQKICSLL